MAHNEPFSASTHKKIRACHINMGIRVDTKQIKSEQTLWCNMYQNLCNEQEYSF